MSEISDLKVIRQKPNENLIQYLELALKLAKEGELKGIVVAQLWSNESTSHAWRLPGDSLWNTPRIIGEMHVTMTALSNTVNNSRDSD